MAERIEAIKVTLNQSLNDKEKPWKKFFDLAEEKSGVPRVYLFAGEYNIENFSHYVSKSSKVPQYYLDLPSPSIPL